MELVVDASTVLRPRSLANERAIYAFLDKNRAYLGKWVAWVRDYKPEKLHQDILDTLQETADGTFLLFDIFYNDEFVGAVDAHDVVAGQSAELGYYIGEKFIGKGLATHCTQKLIDFLIEHSNIHYFYLEVIKGNSPSIRVAEKLGFIYASQHVDDGITWLKYEKRI